MKIPPSTDSAKMPPVERSDFFPIGPIEGKRNFKRFFLIERDGLVRESIHLDVPDASLREEIVCLHYLRHLVRNFLKAPAGIRITGRDCPWDFNLQLSTGHSFYLEVTSIADAPKHFEINKREERFRRWAGEEFIPVHELDKLSRLFNGEDLVQLAERYSREGRAAAELVPNPLRDATEQVFLSTKPDALGSLADAIRMAIDRKAIKPHSAKDRTIIVIDNRRSACTFADYQNAAMSLEPYLAALPFPEVWLYTGFYSNDDGTGAEFNIASLKATVAQKAALELIDPDRTGVQHCD